MLTQENDTLLQVIHRLEQKIDAMSDELTALKQQEAETQRVLFRMRDAAHQNTVTLFGAIEMILDRQSNAAPRKVNQSSMYASAPGFAEGLAAGAVLFDD